MVKRNFRDSATRHHGRRHGSAPRDVRSDEVHSHVPESAPGDGKNNHNEAENPREERGAKMTKRTARMLGKLAASVALAFTLSATAASFESGSRNAPDVRPDVRAGAFDQAERFIDREVRFDRGDSRDDARECVDFERGREIASRDRSDERLTERVFDKPETRPSDRDAADCRDQRADKEFAAQRAFRPNPDVARSPDERFSDRPDVNRDFDRGREFGLGDDVKIDRGAPARFGSFNA